MSSSSWLDFRKFTQARIGIGRAGHATKTEALLKFQADHAQARDAIHLPWDIAAFRDSLPSNEILIGKTQVTSREMYLQRPDLGRKLSQEFEESLKLVAQKRMPPDVALIVSNGLSSLSVATHGAPLVKLLLEKLRAQNLTIAPLVLIPDARVAVSDPVGQSLGARLTLIVIGERPGLSSANSLAIYLTFAPKPGNTDAQRNCISNIRLPDGLSYEDAAHKACFLVVEAFRRGLSGVQLKDESEATSAKKIK